MTEHIEGLLQRFAAFGTHRVVGPAYHTAPIRDETLTLGIPSVIRKV